MDETTDILGRYVVNIVVGTLEVTNESKVYLLDTQFLKKVDSTTMACAFDDAMRF